MRMTVYMYFQVLTWNVIRIEILVWEKCVDSIWDFPLLEQLMLILYVVIPISPNEISSFCPFHLLHSRLHVTIHCYICVKCCRCRYNCYD